MNLLQQHFNYFLLVNIDGTTEFVATQKLPVNGDFNNTAFGFLPAHDDFKKFSAGQIVCKIRSIKYKYHAT